METFSEIFQRTHGAPIEVDGRIVQPIFQVKIDGVRKTFVIRRLKSRSASVAGLRIKAEKGEIEVHDERHPEIILWADTSPESVSLSVLSKAGCELRIWNVWRAGRIIQAWVGNAGIVATKSNGTIRLECSGGDEEVNFSALVVEIDKIGA